MKLYTTIKEITSDGNYSLGNVLGSTAISVKGDWGGGSGKFQYSDDGTNWYDFEQSEASFSINTSIILDWAGLVRFVLTGSTTPDLIIGFKTMKNMTL